MSVETKLEELGLALPVAPKPAGRYAALVRAGSLLFISGQLPVASGELCFTGRVGAELTEEEGRAAARLAALNVLAQIKSALGGFEQLEKLVRVEGHVASAPGWTQAPRVLDAASDLLASVLGDRGVHARAAFSPGQLPLNTAVELVVIAAVKTVRKPGRRRTV